MADREQNLTWNACDQAYREMMERIERELALAFYRGYDGMDVFDRGAWDIKCQPWYEGNKPHRPQWAHHHHRYYLDGITYQDIRELHEGVDD